MRTYTINVAIANGKELKVFSETYYTRNFADARVNFYKGKGALLVHKEYE